MRSVGDRRAMRARSDRPISDAGPVLDLARYVPALLTFVSNKLSRSGSALYRRHFGVGIIEWRVLTMLALEPSIPASRVCQVIGLDKGPVSRSLAGLERQGLVTIRADATDTRRRLATLTPAGRALHDRIIMVALERERRLLSCLTAEQQDSLIELLNLLHENLGAVNRPIPIPPAAPPVAEAADETKSPGARRKQAGSGR